MCIHLLFISSHDTYHPMGQQSPRQHMTKGRIFKRVLTNSRTLRVSFSIPLQMELSRPLSCACVHGFGFPIASIDLGEKIVGSTDRMDFCSAVTCSHLLGSMNSRKSACSYFYLPHSNPDESKISIFFVDVVQKVFVLWLFASANTS